VGYAVDDPLAEVDPDRKAARAVAVRPRRRTEIVDLLPRRAHAVADHVGEELCEPWAAGVDVYVRFDRRRTARRHRFAAIGAAGSDERVAHHLASAPCGERSRPPFEPHRLDTV